MVQVLNQHKYGRPEEKAFGIFSVKEGSLKKLKLTYLSCLATLI